MDIQTEKQFNDALHSFQRELIDLELRLKTANDFLCRGNFGVCLSDLPQYKNDVEQFGDELKEIVSDLESEIQPKFENLMVYAENNPRPQ
ncbi:hypothetical protein K9N68_33740 [Kovacikia minuta CCNUW1]|uniref:hypothetical protein n=1 Tax=Kovacikia minuta TaxID=2931930 RepID=UPI001CCC1717|nr:hypothetical protein [Kovacikia minuta]UBF26406.1 hypothetical protein K9N68_33740 [Kovacikia minuta CCNUW1]